MLLTAVLFAPWIVVLFVSLPPLVGLTVLALTAIVIGLRRVDFDAVTLLTVYAIALFVIPSQWVFGPLGAIGTPANLIGMVAPLWVALGAVHPSLQLDQRPNP